MVTSATDTNRTSGWALGLKWGLASQLRAADELLAAELADRRWPIVAGRSMSDPSGTISPRRNSEDRMPARVRPRALP